ncbi:MAG: endonuclease/exonuclease/phosphatase family protein [Patescibacteria group bacterium]
MKIVSHNLEFLFEEGVHSHSRKNWVYSKEFANARVNHFAKLFSELDADVVLLQEVASKIMIERIIEKSGIHYHYFIATPDSNGVGNAILYKDSNAECQSVPAVAGLPVFIDGDIDVIGPRIYPRRDFAQLTTTYHGKKLHLISIHIKANFLMPKKNDTGDEMPMDTQISAADGRIRSEFFRMSQAKKVREMVDDFFVNDPDALVLVGGDFNAEEHSPILRIIGGEITEASDHLFSACQKVELEKRYSSITKNRTRLLDHFLISKALVENIIKINILNDNLSDYEVIEPNPTAVMSDHAPIVIEFI